MNRRMKVATRGLDLAEGAVLIVVLVGLVGLTFAGVVLRYVFNSPFTWMEEVQVASLVWLTFLGSSMAFRHYGHVAVEIVVDALPERVQAFTRLAIAVVVYLVLAYLFVRSLDFIEVFAGTGRSTPVLGIPFAVIYGIAPVSCVLMAISYTVSEVIPAIKDVRSGTLHKHTGEVAL